MRRSIKRLSSETKKIIIDLKNKGLSGRAISRELRIAKSTVNDFLARSRKEVKPVISKAKDTKPTKNLGTMLHKNYPDPVVIDTNKLLSEDGSLHYIIADTQYKDGVDLTYLSAVGHHIAEIQPDVIVHLGDHFDMPSLSSYDKGKGSAEGRRVLSDIVAGRLGMNALLAPIKAAQEASGGLWKPKMVFTIGNHCLSEDSEVLTKERGFVNIKDVDIGEEVYSHNPDSSEGCWTKVSRKVKTYYQGDMYGYDSKSFNISCTDKHRFYTKTSTGNSQVVLAKDMKKDFRLTCSAFSRSGLEGFCEGDLLKLSAWFCTDSHFTTGGEVLLYQIESNSHKIRDLLNNLGISFKERRSDRDIKEAGIVFSISKEEASKVPVTSNKIIPSWLDTLSYDQFSTFLETVVDADGTLGRVGDGMSGCVVYGSKIFLESLQIACVTKGYSAHLVSYREKDWKLNINNRSVRRVCDTEPTKTPFEGYVYCIEVPTGNFLMRREGKCHFTGNCARLARYIEDTPELQGVLSYADFGLEENGWEVYDFLEPATVNGVSYIHFVPNPMTGKPYGGSALSILKNVGDTFVQGHKQIFDYAQRPLPLTGRTQHGLIIGACYLHDEGYKGYTGNNHFRGIAILRNVSEGDFSIEAVKLLDIIEEYKER